MAKVGKDVIAGSIYVVFCAYLFHPHLATLEIAQYLIPFNICFGAFGAYVLSKRWVAGFGGRFFTGTIYGFGPFMFFLAGFHPTAGSFAAIVPWLFLLAAFGPKGIRLRLGYAGQEFQWMRIPLGIVPFVILAAMFKLAGLLGLYPIPTQISVMPEDLASILAPAALASRADLLVGFYHIPLAGLVIGLAMLAASRRYSVFAVIFLGIVLSIFDSFTGTPRIIWLSVPLLCCSAVIGEGIEGIIHCGYSDRKWVLASAIVLLICGITALLFGTKATHVFAGLGTRYTRLFIEAAQMYMLGAIAVGVVFFLAKGKSRLMWLRSAIICLAVGVDILLGAGHIIDSVM